MKRTTKRKEIVRGADPTVPSMSALLRRSLDRAQRQLLKKLAAAGFDDVGLAHLQVLRHPPPNGERPGDLARRANMTKQAMNYSLGQVEQMGYLTRSPETGLVSLTDRGRRVCTVLQRAARSTERSWAARVGERRFAVFLEVLRELDSMPED